MKKYYQFKRIANHTENIIAVNDGIIEGLYCRHECSSDLPIIDYGELIALPGFIDCHMHGALGYDAATCGADNLVKLAQGLYMHGEVAFMPTIPAAHPEQNRRALNEIEKAMKITWEQPKMAKILGCHMEGPFLCEAYKGALDETAFCDCTPAQWELLAGEYSHLVKRITVDPLRPGVLQMIPYFKQRNIQVSLGHTAADADTVSRAFAAGATSVTHLYNAMSGLHHRNPGTVGAALADDDSYCELITDFLHVAPQAVKTAIKAKAPRKIAIITDSCQAAGMPDGEYALGGRLVHVVKGEARMPEGQLASSTVFMDRELQNLLYIGVSLDDCSLMLSQNPADLCGEARLGDLSEGKLFAAVLTNEAGKPHSILD